MEDRIEALEKEVKLLRELLDLKQKLSEYGKNKPYNPPYIPMPYPYPSCPNPYRDPWWPPYTPYIGQETRGL